MSTLATRQLCQTLQNRTFVSGWHRSFQYCKNSAVFLFIRSSKRTFQLITAGWAFFSFFRYNYLCFGTRKKKGRMKGVNQGKKYILLDGLECSIVEYFYESRCILACPQRQSKYKRRVKISCHDTKVTTNKKFIIQLEGFERYKIELSKLLYGL